MCLDRKGKSRTKEAKENRKNHIGYKVFQYDGRMNFLSNKRMVRKNKTLEEQYMGGRANITGEWNIDESDKILYYDGDLGGYYSSGYHVWLQKNERSVFTSIYAKVEFDDVIVEGFQSSKPVIVCRKYRVLEVYVWDYDKKEFKLIRKNKVRKVKNMKTK